MFSSTDDDSVCVLLPKSIYTHSSNRKEIIEHIILSPDFFLNIGSNNGGGKGCGEIRVSG